MLNYNYPCPYTMKAKFVENIILKVNKIVDCIPIIWSSLANKILSFYNILSPFHFSGMLQLILLLLLFQITMNKVFLKSKNKKAAMQIGKYRIE